MRMTIGFLGLLCLVGSACSDDGLAVQQPLNSSSGGSASGETPTTGLDPGTASMAASSDAADSEGSDSSTPGETGTTGQATGTSGPVSTTGPADTDPGSTGTDSGSTGDPGSTGGSSSTGDVCMPLSDDPTGINVDCMNDLDCPAGYVCQPFVGFVLSMQCQIPCNQDCECPLGYTCAQVMDKSGASWMQCQL